MNSKGSKCEAPSKIRGFVLPVRQCTACIRLISCLSGSLTTNRRAALPYHIPEPLRTLTVACRSGRLFPLPSRDYANRTDATPRRGTIVELVLHAVLLRRTYLPSCFPRSALFVDFDNVYRLALGEDQFAPVGARTRSLTKPCRRKSGCSSIVTCWDRRIVLKHRWTCNCGLGPSSRPASPRP